EPQPKPDNLTYFSPSLPGFDIDQLGLLPTKRWHHEMMEHWRVGESAAHQGLSQFVQNSLAGYGAGRDLPGLSQTTRLAAHLHFGEISPNTLWYTLNSRKPSDDAHRLQTQLGWRDFSYMLLYYNPNLPNQCLQKQFERFPWKGADDTLNRWQRGLTGYPLVDAGMRELWQTGYMHNRVRMVVASFLVKNLLLDWRLGAQWFWYCLNDADLANNSASWQWVAGCGADAAPYFRIFNPTTQGEKFDPDGTYTKRFVTELRDMPKKYLFKPYDAPESVLQEAGVRLGDNYPHPVVELKFSRQRALDALATLKR
ncbi:MAG: FAD-binding domain-containing protein, partial [Pseudomonadota bacterium]